MVEVSEDIFFQVKREILDKLDIILQKVNLSLLNELQPGQSYAFIQLSTFEQEISILFKYLDRLYASLNSSISFSSIASFKSNCESYALQNARLQAENASLKAHLTEEPRSKNGESKLRTMRIAEQIEDLSEQFVGLERGIKKSLKAFKFELLESRVEMIARLKQWEGSHKVVCETGCDQEVMDAIDDILAIC